MWKLLKAEMSYYRYYLIFPLIFILCFAALMIWDQEKWYRVFGFTHNIGLVSLIFMFISRFKEKRDRLQYRLPLSIFQLAIVRILLPVCFFLTGTMLMASTLAVVRPEHFTADTLLLFLQDFLLQCLVITVFLVNVELGRSRFSVFIKALFGITLAGMLFLGMTFWAIPGVVTSMGFTDLGKALEPYLSYQSVGTWFYILAISFVSLSVFTFTKRRTFIGT